MILAALGRTDEAVALLRRREQEYTGRLGKLYLTSLRALLEDNREESLKASDDIRRGSFRDPEGLYHLARQLGHMGETSMALEVLSRAISKGFFCYPAMLRDPWLDGLRGSQQFVDLVRKAQELHREALSAFLALGGDALLGTGAESY